MVRLSARLIPLLIPLPLLAACAGSPGGAEITPAPTADMIGGIACVVDGESLRIGATRVGANCQGGVPVTLHGIIAPNRRQTGGWEASAALTGLVEGRPLQCQPASLRGAAGLAAVCSLNGRDVARMLVSQGAAASCARRSRAYVGLEAEARAERRGIWALGWHPPAECVERNI